MQRRVHPASALPPFSSTTDDRLPSDKWCPERLERRELVRSRVTVSLLQNFPWRPVMIGQCPQSATWPPETERAWCHASCHIFSFVAWRGEQATCPDKILCKYSTLQSLQVRSRTFNLYPDRSESGIPPLRPLVTSWPATCK